MTPSDVTRFNAIRQRVGGEKKFTAGALSPEFGKNKTAAGHWLRRMQGAVLEGWRLCAERETHNKQWRYFFRSLADLPPEGAEMRDAAESEARFNTVKSLTWKSHENAKQIKKIDARAEEAKAAAEFAEVQKRNTVEVAEDTMLVPTADGQGVERVPFTWANRDGQMVKVPGLPAPKAAKKPAAAAAEPWRPGCGRAYTHDDAIAANQRTANPGGFLDPYGTLAHSDNVRQCEMYRGGWRQVGPSSMSDPNWRQKL